MVHCRYISREMPSNSRILVRLMLAEEISIIRDLSVKRMMLIGFLPPMSLQMELEHGDILHKQPRYQLMQITVMLILNNNTTCLMRSPQEPRAIYIAMNHCVQISLLHYKRRNLLI